MPALPIRQFTQGGLESTQPLPEVVDAPDRVAGLDQPVDVLIEPDAVVVRVHHVVGRKFADQLGTQRGDRLGDESDGQPVEVRGLPIAVGVKLVERAGRDAGGYQAQRHPGEHVRYVELPRVGGVGQDHAAAEHRDRQPAQVVRLAQQHLAGPLAVAVAVGHAVVDGASWADDPDVGVLGEHRRLDLVAHVGGRHVGVGLEFGGEGDPDQLGGAHHVGPE